MDCELLNNLEMEDVPFQHYVNDAGVEHYRLLKHMAKGLDLVVDVGTYWGLSAMALSSAKRVESFDIADHKKDLKFPTNINFNSEPVLSKLDLLKKADMILLDTFHNGGFEKVFYDTLVEIGYEGILLLDDIHLNKPMEEFWSSIDQRKEDITHLGHYTGTGMVYFK